MYQIVNIVLTNDSSGAINFLPKSFIAAEIKDLGEASRLLASNRAANIGRTILLSESDNGDSYGKIVAIELFDGNNWLPDDYVYKTVMK